MSKNTIPDLQALAEGLASSTLTHDNIATAENTKDVANVSTIECEESPAFDSMALETVYQARAGAASEHLNFVNRAQPGKDLIGSIKHDLSEVAERLTSVRFPATVVNIELGKDRDGRTRHAKIEVPHEVKEYGEKLNADKYLEAVSVLLSNQSRMLALRAHVTKANQMTTPALWLNQAICIETKKPYVYMISQHLDDELKSDLQELLSIPKETEKQIEGMLQLLLGRELFDGVKHIADANRLTAYVVFIILCDRILDMHTKWAEPVTTGSIWEKVAPLHEGQTPALTAARVVNR